MFRTKCESLFGLTLKIFDTFFLSILYLCEYIWVFIVFSLINSCWAGHDGDFSCHAAYHEPISPPLDP